MFLEQQIRILEWFLKIMWHWRLEKWCWFRFDTTGINYISKYIQMEIRSFKLKLYFTIFALYCIFDQINAALVSIRDFFENIKKLSCSICEINFHGIWQNVRRYCKSAVIKQFLHVHQIHFLDLFYHIKSFCHMLLSHLGFIVYVIVYTLFKRCLWDVHTNM